MPRVSDGKVFVPDGDVEVVVRATRSEMGREERFRALYGDCHPSIYRYVYRRLPGSAGDAHDVVAEVFALAWRRLDDVPASPEDRLWLYGVARRYVSRTRRSGLRRARLQIRLSEEARTRGSLNGGEDATAAVVRDAIERLRPRDRELLQLVMWDGLSHAEAGQVLGCSANAVGVRLHKAREQLRLELDRRRGRERSNLGAGAG